MELAIKFSANRDISYFCQLDLGPLVSTDLGLSPFFDASSIWPNPKVFCGLHSQLLQVKISQALLMNYEN